MSVKAHEIKHALSQKHSGDFFLTEVKNGSTWNGRDLFIMDALAIKKSWANPSLTGYEIKVSRSDFMRDDKWPAYKELTHRFSFVCPKGLIQPEELPDDVGLLWYNREKKTFYTKRKAAYRDIQISVAFLYYIIMSRIESDRHPFFSSRREYLESYVEDKANRSTLGYHVSNKLSKELRDLQKEKQELEYTLKRFERERGMFKEITGVMKKHGISTHSWEVGQKLDEALSSTFPPRVMELVRDIERSTSTLTELLNKK